MPKYPHNSLKSVPICGMDEKMNLGERWKPTLGRFVLLLRRRGGYKRMRGEGDRNRHVYEKAEVGVGITRRGIPSIRGPRGVAPGNRETQAILALWSQAKRAEAA